MRKRTVFSDESSSKGRFPVSSLFGGKSVTVLACALANGTKRGPNRGGRWRAVDGGGLVVYYLVNNLPARRLTWYLSRKKRHKCNDWIATRKI